MADLRIRISGNRRDGGKTGAEAVLSWFIKQVLLYIFTSDVRT